MTAPSPSFPDHFSAVAAGYATYRPHYPAELFETLAALSPATDVAWDCGAGSGQASVALARHFARVVATDASAQQVAEAEPHPRVTYHVAPAERSGLESHSVSLVTVAQALHWFDVDAFHDEVRRVLVPHGVIAEWCYQLLYIPSAPAVEALVSQLDARLKSWWPPQRAHVDAGYADLGFPFARVETGAFAMEAQWTAAQLVGYVATWSAVTRFRASGAEDPMVAFARDVASCWGDAAVHTIRWPLMLRVGRVNG